MGLVERASGSWKFSEEYSRNENKLRGINKEKVEVNGRLRAIMKDRKKADQLIRDIEKSGQLIEREVKLETQMYSVRFLALKHDTRLIGEKVQRAEAGIRKNDREVERVSGLVLKNSTGGAFRRIY